jgi:hypothetical protein
MLLSYAAKAVKFFTAFFLVEGNWITIIKIIHDASHERSHI